MKVDVQTQAEELKSKIDAMKVDVQTQAEELKSSFCKLKQENFKMLQHINNSHKLLLLAESTLSSVENEVKINEDKIQVLSAENSKKEQSLSEMKDNFEELKKEKDEIISRLTTENAELVKRIGQFDNSIRDDVARTMTLLLEWNRLFPAST